ncbi:2TM domain-containing protein [Sanyastnella coralliicola]|uniref:2TM domain-containing protein n=1 Tax=Sanyastnella coralliicola TaxID=3069118 RepID=UPI0027B8F50C|nr:2TM domain-containing protein [Longitalea sp. SCSIO 12813]
MNELTYTSNSADMNDQEKYERARKQVEEEKGFYSHLITYVIVITGLIILNQLTSNHQWWYWPALGWGIGLTIHGLGVFGSNFFFGRKWEERRMRQLMEDDQER